MFIICFTMGSFIEVITTFPSREDAERVGELLVKDRAVACAQVSGPIRSIYRWKGNVERDEEWLLTLKTKASLYRKVESIITDNHPYEIPQIIAVPIEFGYKEYLNWIEEEVE